MIARVLAAVLVATVLPTIVGAPAQAECSRVRQQEMVYGQIRLFWVTACAPGQAGSSPAFTGPTPPRDSDWDSPCVRTAISFGLDPARFCDLPSSAAAAPVLTPGRVAQAFRRLPLPAADLVVQPPKGRTLVNFETNFYTERGGFTRSVRLLGRVVELRIWPASFTWRFGDGAEETSREPGAAYPDLQITHRYLHTGRVAPSVDVTYAAQFRVGGGAWRDVDGTVTIPGAPESLRVVTARPVLVGG